MDKSQPAHPGPMPEEPKAGTPITAVISIALKESFQSHGAADFRSQVSKLALVHPIPILYPQGETVPM